MIQRTESNVSPLSEEEKTNQRERTRKDSLRIGSPFTTNPPLPSPSPSPLNGSTKSQTLKSPPLSSTTSLPSLSKSHFKPTAPVLNSPTPPAPPPAPTPITPPAPYDPLPPAGLIAGPSSLKASTRGDRVSQTRTVPPDGLLSEEEEGLASRREEEP